MKVERGLFGVFHVLGLAFEPVIQFLFQRLEIVWLRHAEARIANAETPRDRMAAVIGAMDAGELI